MHAWLYETLEKDKTKQKTENYFWIFRMNHFLSKFNWRSVNWLVLGVAILIVIGVLWIPRCCWTPACCILARIGVRSWKGWPPWVNVTAVGPAARNPCWFMVLTPDVTNCAAIRNILVWFLTNFYCLNEDINMFAADIGN